METAASPPPPPPPAAAVSAYPPAEEPPTNTVASGGEAEDVVVDVSSTAAAGEGEEEEGEGECGFCLFMKGGGCKEEFVAWEKCVEAAEEAGGDVVERCFEATAALRRCMDAHADYYEPILRAERAMAEDIEAQAREPSEPPPVHAPKEEEEEVASEKKS